jgi:ribonuclease HI
MKTVAIYTDGACSGNPGHGGWAAVLIYGDIRREISGFAEETTNNRMEITAAIEGLKALRTRCAVELYTDSAYLANAFNESWIINWSNNGWKKSDKKPVENRDLWDELLLLAGRHSVIWNKVKGHADNEFNNRCDELARGEIKKHTQQDDKPEKRKRPKKSAPEENPSEEPR